jgi:hypothetical protein
VLPKLHILEKSAFFKDSNHLRRKSNAPQVNLERHVFLGFANGGLGNTP